MAAVLLRSEQAVQDFREALPRMEEADYLLLLLLPQAEQVAAEVAQLEETAA